MNIKGIELLRQYSLPGPKRELISTDLSNVDLDWLYLGAPRGATIVVFDSSEPINQTPFLEKNVRKYKIQKIEYFETLDDLIKQMSEKGVRRNKMVFLTHQTYSSEDILYSGRVAIEKDEAGFGMLAVDATESLRKANSDFDSPFVYLCPIVGDRVFRLNEVFLRRTLLFPGHLLSKLIKNVLQIPGNPNIDFEVYIETGKMFYHDMFLRYG